jgi:membrane-associated phospholipid phosphatase
LDDDADHVVSGGNGHPVGNVFFFGLVHQVSARGGARGGAFPSAHASGALVVFLVAWRRQRRLACLLSPIIAGVVMATVYGRFHYALDTVAGLLLAVVVVFSCRRLVDRKSREPRLSPAAC